MANLYLELTRILHGNGWVKLGEGKGSHEIWSREYRSQDNWPAGPSRWCICSA